MHKTLTDQIQRFFSNRYLRPNSIVETCTYKTNCKTLKLSCLLATAMLVSGPVTAAEFYKWTDSKGITHFTDKPPMGIPAEKITGKQRRGDRANEEQASSSSSASISQDQAAARAKRCAAEQSRLKLLQSNSQIRMKKEDGTTKDLSPAEIAEEIGFAQKAIAYYCD